MLNYKTKDVAEHVENDNYSLPEQIQKSVEERGFYLYNWISPSEIKMSIQRDFLKGLNLFATPLAVLSILGSIGVYQFFEKNIILVFSSFFGVIFTGVFAILLYLLGVSIYRSFLLARHAYVVVTDTSMLIGNKQVGLRDTKAIKYYSKKIEEIFEEKLFGISRVDVSRASMYDQVKNKLLGGFELLFNGASKTRGRAGGGVFILIFFYAIYTLFISSAYFIGVFFLWLFVLALTFINKNILLLLRRPVMVINDLFSDIDESANKLAEQAKYLQSLLVKAQEDSWDNSLMPKINTGIERINVNVLGSIEKSNQLKKCLEKSEFKSIFNFRLFSGWLRKQIHDPIQQIRNMLFNNLVLLEKTNKEIARQIIDTSDTSLQGPLRVQKKRVEAQLLSMEPQLRVLDGYLAKL